MDTNPIGFQSWMFGGLVPHLRVLKVGVLAVGSKFFAPPYWAEACQEWGLWRECVSAFPTSSRWVFPHSPNV